MRRGSGCGPGVVPNPDRGTGADRAVGGRTSGRSASTTKTAQVGIHELVLDSGKVLIISATQYLVTLFLQDCHSGKSASN